MNQISSKLSKILIRVLIIVSLFSFLPQRYVSAAYTTDSYIFINEFNYANTATQGGDFIEMAGAARMSLAGWSIQVYNSANAMIGTIPLSGTFPNQQNGFGTLAFSVADLPDAQGGIALINAAGTLVEFISWGGTISVLLAGLLTLQRSFFPARKQLQIRFKWLRKETPTTIFHGW